MRGLVKIDFHCPYAEVKRIFVLGAGVSVSSGYPPVKVLLKEVLEFGQRTGKDIGKIIEVIKVLFPNFNPKFGNFPNIEDFLGLLDTMQAMSLSSEQMRGKKWAPIKLRRRPLYFSEEISEIKEELLRLISEYFFLNTRPVKPFLEFSKRLTRGDVIVTFNWDLLLERSLYELNKSYWYFWRRSKDLQDVIPILKPHGSINWVQREKIHSSVEGEEMGHRLLALREFSPPKGIVPYIIPPSPKKEFKTEEIEMVWNDVNEAFLRADKFYFLGYSLPRTDLQARYIFRMGLMYNKKNREKDGKPPYSAVVVNPDETVFLNYRNILGDNFTFLEMKFEDIDFEELFQ